MGGVCSFCDPNESKNDGEQVSSKDAFLSSGDRTSSEALFGESIVEKDGPTGASTIDEGGHAAGGSTAAEALSHAALEKKKQEEMELIKEQQRVLREKQRLDGIISTAGREMIAIHRRDGYYDPREAAMVASNLHSTLKETTTPGASTPESHFAASLPRIGFSSGTGISEVLASEPRYKKEDWDSFMEHSDGTTVIDQFDKISQAYLDRTLPPTQKEFGKGLGSIVETLP